MKITSPRMKFPPWKAPRFREFAPSGITLGASVVGFGRYHEWQDGVTISGQVWSQAKPGHRTKRWWVVTPGGHPYLCDENDLAVLGQCVDTPLPLVNFA